jgi:hypothetical protein
MADDRFLWLDSQEWFVTGFTLMALAVWLA